MPALNRSMPEIRKQLVSEILNAAWMVRHYSRGGRTGVGATQREQAILYLGAAVRRAFATSDQYEALLEAIVEGLRPKDHHSPF